MFNIAEAQARTLQYLSIMCLWLVDRYDSLLAHGKLIGKPMSIAAWKEGLRLVELVPSSLCLYHTC